MTIGSLAVNVVARTGSLVRGMTKARGVVKTFAIGATVAMGVATAAVAGSLRVFNDMAPAIDRVAKASDRLDIPTEKLTALGHAASLAGTGPQALEKSLTKMLRNVGDAATLGTGAAADAIANLGLNADQLKNQGTEQTFLEIGDAINKLPTAAEKTAAAMAIFGKSGADLLPLFATGSEGIRLAMADAEALGKTFSREQANLVEQANDAMTRAGAAVDGLKTQLTVALAPAIAIVANTFADWVASMNSGAGAAGAFGGAMRGFADALGVVGDVVHTIRIGFIKLQAIVTGVFAWVVRKIGDLVSFAIRSINKIPGIEIDQPQLLQTLAEELERSTDELNAKFDKLFISKTPSERVATMFEKIRADAEKTAAKVAEVPKAVLPPGVESFFKKIGGGLASLSSAPGAAAAAAIQAGASVAKNLRTAPQAAARFASLGEVQSEDRLAGRQDNANEPLKQVAKSSEKQVTLLTQIKDAIVAKGGQVLAAAQPLVKQHSI
jgi:hypothetical protein